MPNGNRTLLILFFFFIPFTGCATPLCSNYPTLNPASASEAARISGEFAVSYCNKNLARACFQRSIAIDPKNLVAIERLGTLERDLVHASTYYTSVASSSYLLEDKARYYRLALACDNTNKEAEINLGLTDVLISMTKKMR